MKNVKQNKDNRFPGSRAWISSLYDRELPATSRPKK